MNDNPQETAPALDRVVSYYSTVGALTLKDGTQALPPKVITESPLYSLIFSPLLIYGCVAFFFLLFVGGLGIQIMYRILDWKKTVTVFFLALMVASTPLALRMTLDSTSLQTRAGPDEVPRAIKVLQMSRNSFAISWTTESEKIGAIRFGPAPLSDKNSQAISSNNNQPSEKHSVLLNNLKSGVEYEYEILSGTRWYNDHGAALKLRLDN